MTSIYLHKTEKGWSVVVDDKAADCLTPDEALGVVAATIFDPAWHARFASQAPHPFVKSPSEWRQHAIDQVERHKAIEGQHVDDREVPDSSPELFTSHGDTWIKHDGNASPTRDMAQIKYLCQNGMVGIAFSGSLSWPARGGPGDIIGYQILSEG